MDRIKLLCVTAGGLGLLKPGPGTWGSLPPVALALGLVLCGAGEVLLWAMLALCLLTSQLCLALTPWAQEHFDCKDPGAMVLDEVAGRALTLACSRVSGRRPA